MLDDLPPEILQHIISFITPNLHVNALVHHEGGLARDADYRQVLSSASLVSHKWCNLFQPTLHRRLVIRTKNQFYLLHRTVEVPFFKAPSFLPTGTLSNSVRYLLLGELAPSAKLKDVLPYEFRALLQHLPNLVELCVHSLHLGAGSLAHPGLERLVVWGSRLSCYKSLHLPSLRHLSLAITDTEFLPILGSEDFPALNLKSIALHHVSIASRRFSDNFNLSILSMLHFPRRIALSLDLQSVAESVVGAKPTADSEGLPCPDLWQFLSENLLLHLEYPPLINNCHQFPDYEKTQTWVPVTSLSIPTFDNTCFRTLKLDYPSVVRIFETKKSPNPSLRVKEFEEEANILGIALISWNEEMAAQWVTWENEFVSFEPDGLLPTFREFVLGDKRNVVSELQKR